MIKTSMVFAALCLATLPGLAAGARQIAIFWLDGLERPERSSRSTDNPIRRDGSRIGRSRLAVTPRRPSSEARLVHACRLVQTQWSPRVTLAVNRTLGAVVVSAPP